MPVLHELRTRDDRIAEFVQSDAQLRLELQVLAQTLTRTVRSPTPTLAYPHWPSPTHHTNPSRPRGEEGQA